MKINSKATYIQLEDGSWANQLMFFTNNIEREVQDEIIVYLNSFFSTRPHTYGFFDTEILPNLIIITTNRGSIYLSQIFRNIERIANHEKTIPLTTVYLREKDTLKEYERNVKSMDNRFSRTQFDCGANKINNFQIDVYFGSSKEEEINRIIFVEYVKDAFAKLEGGFKKKSINTSVNDKYGIVKITVSGFKAKDYTDLVKSVQTRMNHMDLKFDMDDIINIDTGKISVNRKKVVDKKFSALDDKVIDCLDCLEDYLGKHEDPLLDKIQAIQFGITELWNMIIEDEYLNENKG